jgi:hypothetical protein
MPAESVRSWMASYAGRNEGQRTGVLRMAALLLTGVPSISSLAAPLSPAV